MIFQSRTLFLFLPVFFIACAAPRSVNLTPEAAPKGQFRFEADMAGHLPTQTSTALFGGLEGGIQALWNQVERGDTVAITADSMNGYMEAALAYALDPLTMTPGLAFHYGVWPLFDVGYRYEGKAHALQIRHQFLGKPGSGAGEWKGSAALQYSSQKYEMPSLLGLNKLQDLLKIYFKRKDILIPVAFGKGFGADGRFGSFSVGGVYDLALIECGTELMRIFEYVAANSSQPFPTLKFERKIHAYGAFANARLGYRFAFVVASFTTFYQDYGSYELFRNQSIELSGWTFMPSLGLEFRLGGM